MGLDLVERLLHEAQVLLRARPELVAEALALVDGPVRGLGGAKRESTEPTPTDGWCQNVPCTHTVSVKFSRILTSFHNSLKILINSQTFLEIMR